MSRLIADYDDRSGDYDDRSGEVQTRIVKKRKSSTLARLSPRHTWSFLDYHHHHALKE